MATLQGSRMTKLKGVALGLLCGYLVRTLWKMHGTRLWQSDEGYPYAVEELESDVDATAKLIVAEPAPTEVVGEHVGEPEPEQGAPVDSSDRMGETGFLLRDLGQPAEDVYQLLDMDLAEYREMLQAFVLEAFPANRVPPLLDGLELYLPRSRSNHPIPPALVDYKRIWLTDKTAERANNHIRQWDEMHSGDDSNEGWKVDFYDDGRLQEWADGIAVKEAPSEGTGGVDGQDRPSTVEWVWSELRRGVLRADYWRYLVILLEGGVYSDVDNVPSKPIPLWGKEFPRLYDISATDGPKFWKAMSKEPSVILGIEVDVHGLVQEWPPAWPRPLQICQWALAAAPSHPIFLDAVRRVVNATRFIESYAEAIPAKIEALKAEKTEGWEGEVQKLLKQQETRKGIVSVLDHTGPAIWTDSIMTYLKIRYNVTWHELRGIARPLRIGEVLILPAAGFAAGSNGDFHGENFGEQVATRHMFRGSWRGDDD